MITCLLILTLLYNDTLTPDIAGFSKVFNQTVERYGNFAILDYLDADTCIEYKNQLKLDIDEEGNITEMVFSDNAPDIFKTTLIQQLKKSEKFNSKVRNTALLYEMLNCTIVFPLQVITGYGCNKGIRGKTMRDDFACFKNTSFDKPIHLGLPLVIDLTGIQIIRCSNISSHPPNDAFQKRLQTTPAIIMQQQKANN